MVPRIDGVRSGSFPTLPRRVSFASEVETQKAELAAERDIRRKQRKVLYTLQKGCGLIQTRDSKKGLSFVLEAKTKTREYFEVGSFSYRKLMAKCLAQESLYTTGEKALLLEREAKNLDNTLKRYNIFRI